MIYYILMVILYGLAMSVEVMVGFGGTVLSLTIGAWLLPLSLLVPTLVLLNVPMNLNILVRDYKFVQLRQLFIYMAPWILFGMLIGFNIRPMIEGPEFRRLLGVVVAVLGLMQIIRQIRFEMGSTEAHKPLNLFWASFIYILAGIVYALYGKCGPLVAYVLGSRLSERREMRATLNALWLILNLVFLSQNYPMVTNDHLYLALWLAPILPFSYIVGNRLHHRVSERLFRWVVFSLMTVAGLALALGS
jgi:uncharacterized protein